MYIGYGWPKALVPLHDQQDSYIAIHLDLTLLVAVTGSSVQIWSGGPVRVHLGSLQLSPEDIEAVGHHVAACWCSKRRMVAAVVRALAPHGEARVANFTLP